MNSEAKKLGNSINDLKALARYLGILYYDELPDPILPQKIIKGDLTRITGSWAKSYLAIPIAESENEIVVATSEPDNINLIEQLQICFGKTIKIVAAPEEEVLKAINSIKTRLMNNRSSDLKSDEDEGDDEFNHELKIDVTDAEDDDAPIIRYVNAMIFKANSERASDIHIEPYENEVKVRFRIDGVLYDIASEDKMFQAGIASRIKIMAGLNIAEKRLPQDGRIGIKIAGKDVDIRVSTVPTSFGERIVLRILDQTSTVLDLEQIGITGKNLQTVQNLITKPNGIILVTGPTGSGKSTTLYSCLSYINKPELNILTVEDPVEYQLPGIGQMQVNSKIGFTFASGLRAILRQDPDVVMVGEIRDAETAEIAIQASLTGHLVLSTLHTNDSAGAVARLIDMGVEPFLVSSSLLAIMAQRLIRRLCPVCKEEYELTDEELKNLGISPQKIKSRRAFRAGTKPCEFCQNTRYKGRSGIHELLLIDEEIRSLITQRMDSTTIKRAAFKKGFKTLRMDGATKVLAGITSVQEVLLVTHENENL